MSTINWAVGGYVIKEQWQVIRSQAIAHSQARSFQLTSKAEEEPWSKDIRTSLCRLANSSRVAELLSMGYMAGFA